MQAYSSYIKGQCLILEVVDIGFGTRQKKILAAIIGFANRCVALPLPVI